MSTNIITSAVAVDIEHPFHSAGVAILHSVRTKFLAWLIDDLPVLTWHVIIALVFLAIGAVVIWRLDKVFRRYLAASPKVSDLLESFLGHIMSKVLWLILILMLLQYLGFNVMPFMAGFGITGIIIGFAFQDSLSNFAAGFMIAISSPFKVGDLVEMGAPALVGIVREMNMTSCVLTTPDNKRVVIPNRQVWGMPMINHTTLGTRRLEATVSVAYGSDVVKVRAILQAIVERNPKCLKEPAPIIAIISLGDSGMQWVVRPWVQSADLWGTLFEINQAIERELKEAGVAIQLPKMALQVPVGEKK